MPAAGEGPLTIGQRPGRKRCEWADLVDSSREELDAPPLEPPPVVEDTYESQGFDDELPAAMSASMTLQAQARSCSKMSIADDSMDPERDDGANGLPFGAAATATNGFGLQGSTQRACASASRFNPEAPEFVPRPSAAPPRRSAMPRTSALQTFEEVIDRAVAASLDGGTAAAAAPSSSSSQTHPNHRIRHKRQFPGAFSSPALKRSRGAARLTSEEEDEDGRPAIMQSATSSTTSASVREGPATPQPRPAQGEETTEEDWKRRTDKRHSAISNFKETAEYQAIANKRDAGQLNGDEAPKTPDPDDRSLSKRTWESQVAAWRNNLKRMAGGLDLVTA